MRLGIGSGLVSPTWQGFGSRGLDCDMPNAESPSFLMGS